MERIYSSLYILENLEKGAKYVGHLTFGDTVRVLESVHSGLHKIESPKKIV